MKGDCQAQVDDLVREWENDSCHTKYCIVLGSEIVLIVIAEHAWSVRHPTITR